MKSESTFDKPTWGNVSKLKIVSSPVLFCNCPFSILAAVTVDIPMPSPRKRITFLATLMFGLIARALCSPSRACPRQNSGAEITTVHLHIRLISVVYTLNFLCEPWKYFEPPRDKTNKVSVRPAETQISLGIRPVWSESSLSAWRKLGPLATHWAHSEDSDQTGRMPSLIRVFAGRTTTLLVLSRGGSFNVYKTALDWPDVLWYNEKKKKKKTVKNAKNVTINIFRSFNSFRWSCWRKMWKCFQHFS